MKTFSSYPIIFLTGFIITGIVSYEYFPLNINILLVGFIIGMTGFIILHLYQNKRVKKLQSIPVLLAFIAIILGQILSALHNPANNSDYFTRFVKPDNSIKLTVNKKIKATASYFNYYANIQEVNQQHGQGKILLKIPKDKPQPQLGDQIQLLIDKSQIKLIPTAHNPYGFDYRRFMKHLEIYHQINLKNTVYQIVPVTDFNLTQRIATLKNSIKTAFQQHLSPDAFTLAMALLLGERQELSPDIYLNFQATGTVHILAISGLHIGILLLFLNFLFKPVKRYSTVTFLLLTIGFLWFYALLTGFSPSVLRAVIMFSFLQIGLQSKRQTNIFNSLFMAALVMLLINPGYLYQVGFQMSFAAVLSIVSFYPVFSRWFPVKNKILKYFSDLFWVSLSAQLGVLPLSLYYFHQFPGYFLFANLLSIPLLFLILFTGFALMLLSLLHIDFFYPYHLLDFLLNTLLSINKYIAGLPHSLIRNIRFSGLLLLVSFLGVIALYYFLSKSKVYRHWLWLGSWILLFEGIIFYQKYERLNQQNFYVFHQYKTPVVATSNSDNIDIFQNKELIDRYLKKNLKLHFKQIKYDSLPFYQQFDHYKILHIDSLGIYRFQNLKPDIVVLHHSPKINMDRLILELQPKIIVADGSNYPSYIRRWQQSAQKYHVKFYEVNKEGAFVLTKKEK